MDFSLCVCGLCVWCWGLGVPAPFPVPPHPVWPVGQAVRTSQNRSVSPSVTRTQSSRTARPDRSPSAEISRRWHFWSGRLPPGTRPSQSAVMADPPSRTHPLRSARPLGAMFIRSASVSAMRNIATLPASRANRFEAFPEVA